MSSIQVCRNRNVRYHREASARSDWLIFYEKEMDTLLASCAPNYSRAPRIGWTRARPCPKIAAFVMEHKAFVSGGLSVKCLKIRNVARNQMLPA